MLSAVCLTASAQNIDFDLPGKTAPGKDTEVNYISWAVPRAESDTKTLNNGMTITISAGGAASAVGSNWSKTDVETNGLRVIADGVLATNIEDGNMMPINDASTSLILTISGMTPGKHTLKAYHNNSDKDQTQPDIDISVDGTVVATKQKFTSAARSTAQAGTSFIAFNVTEGQPVVITYTTVPESGKTYTNTRMMLNGLEFDVAEMVATDPLPANHNYHAGTEDGTITFSWTAAPGAVQHKFVFGTDSATVAEATAYDYEGAEPSFTKSGLYSMQRYWWRVDEVDASGTVHKGVAWTCQPCQLAFPGAEGYGRYAIGGRGGVVYHVTNLKNDHQPGSLLYGLVDMEGPRTIVFDVSGVIDMEFAAQFVKPYATIAAQTAPGKGICLRASNVNIGSDVICRFVRFKRGLGVYGENTGNAMGMTGADHAIVDHCTAAWGTDETVSGRGAKNISFQYSIISEALGITGHKNYTDGTNHGYAATIDGQKGSWHHNLLVNCEGRNWSMGGGMDGNNRPIGGLDLFNNVCYNWYGRTTDGNCHAVNFVNNYYKMGPDTKKTILFTQDFEGAIAEDGINQAYISGNIRENKNHTLTQDKKDVTYNAVVSKGGKLPTDYPYVVDQPLFPSYAEIHSAKDALKIVTSYSGATMPMRDEQHQRNVRETMEGSYTYIGSKSGIKGEIDTEADITEHSEGKGWEEWPEEKRPDEWDTDQDGMPNWYEALIGSNPQVANHNDDPDQDGWTLLEGYLEFMAHPYLIVQPNGEAAIDLKPHFAGFYGQNGKEVTPTYSVALLNNGIYSADINGSLLYVHTIKPGGTGVYHVDVTATDGETSFTQRIGIAISDDPTGIPSVSDNDSKSVVSREFFTLDGRKVNELQPHEVYLMKTTDSEGKVRTVKVIKN